MINYILAFILGGLVVIYIYEASFERKDKRIKRLLAPKIEDLIEISSGRINKRQKDLKRELTTEEKNSICDECYEEI